MARSVPKLVGKEFIEASVKLDEVWPSAPKKTKHILVVIHKPL